ncbi:cGMP-specific 3',5'-cyclic phosphodiesterase-like isoform X2 [Ruditapes philippinarum]|uniref:cGMP-specific 3',5'-cyclic phosphodiesterase-like isoform X2 n=1 Tax=Ruditapes philippinarum TaxID=129788 RepID=UPI00295BA701|nr:cGMP-specific 3',5'-cyclic phosphodiesterase-like isoform X2 [Ruditapes philippinarum]XP_060580418.1 cGMP-specific 3',5'-cyclic phosphodiesterase-like isoform X2 [Ruditapes philippinarum]
MDGTNMETNLNEEDVENFLLENSEFLENWLKKHATPELMYRIKNIDAPGLKPKFNASARNSITSNMFKNYVDGMVRKRKRSLVQRDKLLAMNESEMFMELIRDIASELDVNVLCHKILRNVSVLTGSDRGSLFLVRGSKDNRLLVSKLFDVTENSTLEDSLHTEETEIKIPLGKGIVGTVALTKEAVNIKDAYEDPRFNKDIDIKTGYRTHSILCMPIQNHDNEVIGVAQIINKITGNHEFEEQDVEMFRKYLMFCGIGIMNAQLFEMSVQEYQRNKLLLNLARGVFEEQQNLEKLVQKIMLDAQELLQCERCSVYLIDDTLDAPHYVQRQVEQQKNGVSNDASKERTLDDIVFLKVFDFYAKDGNIHVQSATQLAQSKNAEIARYVAFHETHLCIADIEHDGRFGKGPFLDQGGFTTRSILCMPVYNSERKITAVTQLINKQNGSPFNDSDANIIEAFSIFTGLGIHNCQMYENACRLMARQTVALEVLSFHATAGQEETERLAEKSESLTGNELKLYTYEFNDLVLSDDQTLQSVICMFKESGLVQKYKIPMDVICRWTCSVKKNYRPVTYHNWRHAFNVTQTMFTMLFTGRLLPVFSELEILAMLVACLCHDLDHRGTNNAFQVKVVSPLAMLYSTSVMEHHHFDHSIMILNSEGNNIFQSLSPEEYREVIKQLEFCILSTDLALYFRKRGDFKKLIDSGRTDFKEKSDKNLLKAMMMTACDVAAITKPWEVQKEVAQLVANEFFEQGDVEKTQLGETPIAMMDRDKKDELPKMQVGFIDAICLPVYEMFSELWPTLKPMYEGCKENRENWNQLANSPIASPEPSGS